MKFIYADELKKSFNIYGHFYNLKLLDKVFHCRSVLEIKRKKSINKLPDIIVIMMNPGSSIPLNKFYKPKTYSKKKYFCISEKELVPTRPDNAQYQIMRLMQMNNWNFVKVLNLSDLRNGNSSKFQTEFKNANKLDISNPHSITHVNRKKELYNSIKSKSNNIIAAWGSIPELHDSAEKILKLDKNIIGVKNGEGCNFKYASPYIKKQKIMWLQEIQNKILDNLLF